MSSSESFALDIPLYSSAISVVFSWQIWKSVLWLSMPSHLWSCTSCRLSKLLLQIIHWSRHKSTREIARKWFQQKQKLPIFILQCCSLGFLYCIPNRAHWWAFSYYATPCSERQLIYFQIKFYLLGISFTVRFGTPLFSDDFWQVTNLFLKTWSSYLEEEDRSQYDTSPSSFPTSCIFSKSIGFILLFSSNRVLVFFPKS